MTDAELVDLLDWMERRREWMPKPEEVALTAVKALPDKGTRLRELMRGKVEAYEDEELS